VRTIGVVDKQNIKRISKCAPKAILARTQIVGHAYHIVTLESYELNGINYPRSIKVLRLLALVSVIKFTTGQSLNINFAGLHH
jgi:hypothetical protein